MLDAAVTAAGPPGIGKGAGAYASRVHGTVKKAIEESNETMRDKGKPELQLGVPEQSIRKDGSLILRFEKGTIRPDLNKLRNEKVWCVFEHKISVAATVDDERMDEIAIRISRASSQRRGEMPDHLVVIETKPRNPPELRTPANR